MPVEVVMEDVHSETHGNRESTQTSEGGETADSFARLLSSQTWSDSSNSATQTDLPSEVAAEDPALCAFLSEPLLAFILKTAASVLQPSCSGGSAVMPVHLQGEGVVDTHVSQTLAAPVIAHCPGSLSLPLIIDQSEVQYISSQLRAQPSCLIPEQQCHVLKSTSVPSSQPWLGDAKSNPPSPLPVNPALHTYEFTAASRELYSILRNRGSPAFHVTRPAASPTTETCLHPESAPPYLHSVSPLVSLGPPATMLVPCPLLVTCPVPLPIPIPIPIPIPVYNMKKNRSSQTPAALISMGTHNPNSDYSSLQFPVLNPPSGPPEEVLDLSVKVTPVQSEQECRRSALENSALDLSVSCNPRKSKCHGNNSANVEQIIQPRVMHDFNIEWTVDHRSRESPTQAPGHNRALSTGQRPTGAESVQRPTGAESVQRRPAVLAETVGPQAKGHSLKNKMIQLKRSTPHSINLHPVKKQHAMTYQPG